MNDNQAYRVINIGANVFFIIDIFIQMRTSYYNQEGEEIIDPKKIRIHYIFGKFPIDLISSLPIEIILPDSSLRTLNILKIVRITRLTTIINKL